MTARPEPAVSPIPALSGMEGELVSISIAVEPKLLELLLDALAEVSFPVNPELLHEASTVRVFPDGRRELEPTTIVEFPAYAGRLDEVRRVLSAHGFDPSTAWTVSMLERLHSDSDSRPAPDGAPYVKLIRYRRQAPSNLAG